MFNINQSKTIKRNRIGHSRFTFHCISLLQRLNHSERFFIKNRCLLRIHLNLRLVARYLLLYQLLFLIFLVRDGFERSVHNLKSFFFCWRSAYVVLSRSIPVVSSICTIDTSRSLPSVSDSQLCVLGVRELHPIKVPAVVLCPSTTRSALCPFPLSTDLARILLLRKG